MTQGEGLRDHVPLIMTRCEAQKWDFQVFWLFDPIYESCYWDQEKRERMKPHTLLPLFKHEYEREQGHALVVASISQLEWQRCRVARTRT